MATRAKTPPPKAQKSKKTATPKSKSVAPAKPLAKPTKPVATPTKTKKSVAKETKPVKNTKTAAAPKPKVVVEQIKTAVVEVAPSPIKKKPAKSIPSFVAQAPKPAKTTRNVKPIDDDEDLIEQEEILLGKGRKKVAVDLDDDDDEIDEIDDDDDDRPAKGRNRESVKKGVKARKRSATEEFLEEDMDEVEEVEDAVILDDLDPFASTLILDPELAGPPIPPVSQLPPRPKRLAPRMQICVDCKTPQGWLSIEKVCFGCLKKRVAQRKKDEDYSGYGGSEDSGGDEDY